MKKSRLRKYGLMSITPLVFLIISFYWVTPIDTKKPYSTVLFSSEGDLLSFRVNKNGQWRFPPEDSIPKKYEECLLLYEDEHFYHHPGINPFSVLRAVKQNIEEGSVVSGGSTLTMQLARILADNPPRTFARKVLEAYQCLAFEWRFSKAEILKSYASNAPFGGNVIGLSAASWRYFNRPPNELSWAESATLAVLPNAPGLMYPGKSNKQLEKKRNALLLKLLEQEVIYKEDYELSLLEKVPDRPQYQPQKAYHFMRWLEEMNGEQNVFSSTIESGIQNRLNRLVDGYAAQYRNNQVRNMGVVVLDVKNKSIVGYVGNSKDTKGFSFVDVCRAPRSSGSVLKPLLYAQMISKAELTPNSLIHDLPINYDGFIPKNYTKQYEGLVPVSKALTKSLNAPAVAVLHQLGIRPFYDQLQQLGFSTLKFPPSHYGLTLILGGGEITLLDLVGVYGAMNAKMTEEGKVRYRLSNEVLWDKTYGDYDGISKWAWNNTLEMMKGLERPAQEWGWEWFQSKQSVSWKTGTSFGHRDAWAIGSNSRYVVGVWVGNQEGDGRPGLTGVNYAAPVMFRAFELLTDSKESNERPHETSIQICQKSGFKAQKHCKSYEEYKGGEAIQRLPKCRFHQTLLMDSTKSFRVKKDCYSGSIKISKPYFCLSPFELYYYKRSALDYEPLPEYYEGCRPEESHFRLVYPKHRSTVFLPIDVEGEQQEIILEAVAEKGEQLYWHLNNDFITETKKDHKVQLNLLPGNYELFLLNQNGVRKRYSFTVRRSDSSPNS